MKTPPKHIIEIADFLLANPEMPMGQVTSIFVEKYRKTSRTIDRYFVDAKKYNLDRLQQQEKARNKVLVAEAEKSLKKVILSRNERLEILSNIAKGTARKIENELIVPSDSDRIRAISEISKMQGDYAPEKQEVELKTEPTPKEVAEFFKELGIIQDC